MQEECSCGYCKENTKNPASLNIQDSQWLEELGDMIETAVAGVKKEQSVTSGCMGRQFTA